MINFLWFLKNIIKIILGVNNKPPLQPYHTILVTCGVKNMINFEKFTNYSQEIIFAANAKKDFYKKLKDQNHLVGHFGLI